MTSKGTGATMESGSEAVRLTNVDIDNALENNHFQVIFQPIFHLGTGTLLRVESFVRWTHPGLGVLPPGAFISFFESQGRMGELTRHVLTTALDAYMDWRGTEGPGFSVNLAQTDLIEPAFAEWFTGLLRERKFPARLITLECPALPADISLGDATGYFNRLRKTGAQMAIEVRGRANDLLRTIDPFPFHELKTGGSAILRFARTMRGGPGLSAISELLELAKANEADIVAVGVEDQASLKALAGLGFTAAQGNFLATIGDLDAVTPAVVAKVRETLALPAVEGDELDALMRGDVPGTVPTEAATDAPVAEEPAESEETPGATLSPEKIALLKKKAARVAAKRRAERKAAGARHAGPAGEAKPSGAEEDTAAPAEAGTDSADSTDDAAEQARKALEEAAARREADENARRLQSRLSKAYASPALDGGLVEAEAEEDRVPVTAEVTAEAVAAEAAEEAMPVAASAGKRPATRASGKTSKVTHRAAPTRTETLPDPAPDTPAETPAAETGKAAGKKPARKPKQASPLGFSAITPSETPPEEEPAAEDVSAETPPDDTKDKETHVEAAVGIPAPEEATVPADDREEPAAGAAPESQAVAETEAEPEDTPLPLSRSDMTSGLQLSGIADITHEDLTASKAKTDEKAPSGEVVSESDSTVTPEEEPVSAMPAPAPTEEAEPAATADMDEAESAGQAGSQEEWTEPDPEDFRSEDEVLDDAFAGAAELDPTETHTEDADGPVELDSTEREIAGRLRAPRPRRRKNWLMRKHRIWPTHFWPVSWKRKWQELRAEDDDEDIYLADPADSDAEAEDARP